MQRVQFIKNCLDLFCAESGEKVSFEKSKLFCSKNICHQRALEFGDQLGIGLTADLGKYLGVPVIHDRVGKESHMYIVDKVKKRLATWKADTLSMAGRVTLTKAVSSAMPQYAMQTVCLPRSLCDEVDKVSRNFVWGSDGNRRKHHLVGWENVSTPKNCDGLGLKKMRLTNDAYMSKLGWNLMAKKDDLWLGFLGVSINVVMI